MAFTLRLDESLERQLTAEAQREGRSKLKQLQVILREHFLQQQQTQESASLNPPDQERRNH